MTASIPPFAARVAAVVLAAAAFVACDDERRMLNERPLPRPSAPTAVLGSDLVAGEVAPRLVLRNPYEGNAQAAHEGRRYYMWMNCAGCHGGLGGGGIGPPFSDSDWIYGSRPENIYQSIVQGRPNGMPAFDRLSDDVVWKIVTYVRTLDPELETQPMPVPPPGDGTDPASSEEPEAQE
jgi:cytochrome c oxidase cbb3-type subunit III